MNKLVIYKLFLGVVLLFSAMGCEDQLIEEPKTFLSQEIVFSSKAGAISATTGIYEPRGCHQRRLGDF